MSDKTYEELAGEMVERFPGMTLDEAVMRIIRDNRCYDCNGKGSIPMLGRVNGVPCPKCHPEEAKKDPFIISPELAAMMDRAESLLFDARFLMGELE